MAIMVLKQGPVYYLGTYEMYLFYEYIAEAYATLGDAENAIKYYAKYLQLFLGDRAVIEKLRVLSANRVRGNGLSFRREPSTDPFSLGSVALFVIPAVVAGSFIPAMRAALRPEPQHAMGPYLGQTRPGRRPVVFAPGFVSTGDPDIAHGNIAIAPDGGEIVWSFFHSASRTFRTWRSRRVEGRWSAPERGGSEPMVSPDERFLFFYVDHDIYWVDAGVIEEVRARLLTHPNEDAT